MRALRNFLWIGRLGQRVSVLTHRAHWYSVPKMSGGFALTSGHSNVSLSLKFNLRVPEFLISRPPETCNEYNLGLQTLLHYTAPVGMFDPSETNYLRRPSLL